MTLQVSDLRCLVVWNPACEQNCSLEFCVKMINSRNVPLPLRVFVFGQKTICGSFVCDVGRLVEHLDAGIPRFVGFLSRFKVVLSLTFPFASSLQTWIPSSRPPSGLMMFGQRGEATSSSCWWGTKLIWQTRGNRGAGGLAALARKSRELAALTLKVLRISHLRACCKMFAFKIPNSVMLLQLTTTRIAFQRTTFCISISNSSLYC